jgi:hypothetical protein
MLPNTPTPTGGITIALQVTERKGISYEEARAKQEESIAAIRLRRPEEFGAHMRLYLQPTWRIHFRPEFSFRRQLLPGVTLTAGSLG